MESCVVHAIAHKTNMVLVRSRLPEKQSNLLEISLKWLWDQGETPMFNTQSMSGDIAELTQVISARNLAGYRSLLVEVGATEQVTPNLACVTVVGSGFWQSPEIVQKIFAIAADACLVDVKNTAITLCVPEASMATTLNRLHDALILKKTV